MATVIQDGIVNCSICYVPPAIKKMSYEMYAVYCPKCRNVRGDVIFGKDLFESLCKWNTDNTKHDMTFDIEEDELPPKFDISEF